MAVMPERALIEAGLAVVDQFGKVITDPIALAIQRDLDGVGKTVLTLDDRLRAACAAGIQYTTNTLQFLQDTFGMSGQTALDLASQAGYDVSQIIHNDLDGYTNKAKNAELEVIDAVSKNNDSVLSKAKDVLDDAVGAIGGGLKTGLNWVTGKVDGIPLPGLDILGPLAAPFEMIGEALSPLKMIGELKQLFDLTKSAIDTLTQITNWTDSPVLRREAKGIVAEMGAVGALLGAPFGFLPVFADAYAAGIGELIKNEARNLMQPTRLGLPDYILAEKRGVIEQDHFDAMVPDLGFGSKDIEVVRKLTRQMMSASDLTTLWRRGELSGPEIVSKLSELTISEEDQFLLLKLTRYMLSINDLISLWLRGELDESTLDIRLNELGVNPDDVSNLKSLAFFIPPIQDLIHMAVREAFTPEIAEQFGQYEDYPEALTEFGRKHGLSEDWARRYWAAHWELPSPAMGFEMYQRKVIGKDDLNILLRALDVMPYWRDKLTKIAFQPITRVDIRRIHKLKLIDDTELQRRYEDIGYSPSDAAMLSKFTIELNKEEEKYEKAPERDLTTSEVISAYANILIDRASAKTMLTDLGYDPAEIDFKLALAELPAIKRIRNKQIDIIKQRVAYELIDLNGAVDLLNKLDLPPFEMEYQLLDIQMDMELAYIKKQAAAKKAAEAAAKKAAEAAAKKAAKAAAKKAAEAAAKKAAEAAAKKAAEAAAKKAK